LQYSCQFQIFRPDLKNQSVGQTRDGSALIGACFKPSHQIPHKLVIFARGKLKIANFYSQKRMN
jgi:hypothetical protein